MFLTIPLRKIPVFILLLFAMLCTGGMLHAHPMPHSLLSFTMRAGHIDAQLGIPLKEFQVVFPNEDLDRDYRTLLQRRGPWLDEYLHRHMRIADSAGRPWQIEITGKSVSEDEQLLTGKYHELRYALRLTPPEGGSPRHFVMRYDLLMHQLITHRLFLKIDRDWYGGMTDRDSADADLGMLSVNPADNTVPPVVIDLDEGSAWKGFRTMVRLGTQHIGEGTDHLLFLLVLLLPATLSVKDGRWNGYIGPRRSAVRLLQLVTAFTVGHSVSLLLGTLGWLSLPQQPVEVAIAITILVTALHALRPLFHGREFWVAAGFGLVHGLAFSAVLTEMRLDGAQLAYSILGFNIGIELMQLFVVLCTVPWLMVLSESRSYSVLRIGGAMLSIIASLGWIAERISGHPNFITTATERAAVQSRWIVAGIALVAVAYLLLRKRNTEAAD